MNSANPMIVTVNGGSSSIKFSVYRVGQAVECVQSGQIDRIGVSGTTFSFTELATKQRSSQTITAPDLPAAASFLVNWLESYVGLAEVVAVGHRVVHGMHHTSTERITPALLDDLRQISPCDLQHLPGEIALMEAFHQCQPQLPQFACFDTAFHRDMPRVAKLLPLPRRFDTQGVQRYGFHGLSYAYLMEELKRLGDQAATQGRVILAHLGNGASLAAVRDGVGIDTSMGFTPTAGLLMSTRSGDLDPGLVGYLAFAENMTAQQFHDMVNHQSGLLGVSEISSNMQDLLACESTDVRAAEAIELFCYQAKKAIGAFAAALGGLDTLVFTGGIGEHAASIRSRICEGLGFLGVNIDDARNADAANVISTDGSPVTVRVIRTNEELMIARSVSRMLRLDSLPIQE